jgi:hypothetical protein
LHYLARYTTPHKYLARYTANRIHGKTVHENLGIAIAAGGMNLTSSVERQWAEARQSAEDRGNHSKITYKHENKCCISGPCNQVL